VIIYKYPLQLTSDQYLDMPQGSSILSIQIQRGAPTLWALVDDTVPRLSTKRIRMTGTGHELPHGLANNLRFISTVQLDELVWHFFEDDNQ
jgi:hypothetical protein